MSNALKHLNLFKTFAVRFKEANVKALAFFFLHTYQSLKKSKKKQNLKKKNKKTKNSQKKTTKH